MLVLVHDEIKDPNVQGLSAKSRIDTALRSGLSKGPPPR